VDAELLIGCGGGPLAPGEELLQAAAERVKEHRSIQRARDCRGTCLATPGDTLVAAQSGTCGARLFHREPRPTAFVMTSPAASPRASRGTTRFGHYPQTDCRTIGVTPARAIGRPRRRRARDPAASAGDGVLVGLQVGVPTPPTWRVPSCMPACAAPSSYAGRRTVPRARGADSPPWRRPGTACPAPSTCG
jgi:hypothetical protein